MAPKRSKARGAPSFTDRIESDPAHHLAGPFMPQTPLGSNTPFRDLSPALAKKNLRFTPTLWSDIKTMRWAVHPSSALKLLLIPIVLYVNWEALAPYIAPNIPNPFACFLFIQHMSPNSSPERPLYAKGYFDFAFLAYNILFFSLVRQVITINISRPIAKYFGIKKDAKLDRFGEQAYAVVYFSFFGLWGLRIMSTLPTWWYRTEYFYIDYPHWEMGPELKRYYLMQSAYWCQQLIVLVLGLEKPRKDYNELVAHHFVTLWLVGWSYLINLTLVGNAIFMSMDIPDVFLAFSKILNYLQYERAKVVSFGVFVVVWAYFRHWLNLVILRSVWTQYELIPESSRVWSPKEGAWMPVWVKHQMFLAIGALQVLNLFWFYLILRILVRAILTAEATDERSDDEGDGESENKKQN
jgi:acyl-CoA-dependent ceramide synthase